MMKIPDDVFSKTLGNEELLVDMASGQYFGMDPVGTLIWNGLRESKSLAQIAADIASEFDVTVAAAEDDVRAFVQELTENRLLQPGTND